MATTVGVNMSPDLLAALDRGVEDLAANNHPAARYAGGHWGRSALMRLALETMLAGSLDCAPEPEPVKMRAAKVDAWSPTITAWLNANPTADGFTIEDVMQACDLASNFLSRRATAMRIGAILRDHGLTKERRMVKGARLWRWYRRD